jgi:hypothetical protein
MSNENSKLDEFKASFTPYLFEDRHSDYLAESLQSIVFLSLISNSLLKVLAVSCQTTVYTKILTPSH